MLDTPFDTTEEKRALHELIDQMPGEAVHALRAVAQLMVRDQTTAMQILQTIHRYADSGVGDVRKLRPPETGLRLRSGDWRIFLF